jgi:hypothetical protein
MNTSDRRAPTFGILSVTMTSLGILVACLAASLNADQLPRAAIGTVLLVMTLSILGGLVLAITGLIRRERLSWLSITGLAATLGCIGCAVVFAVFFAAGD